MGIIKRLQDVGDYVERHWKVFLSAVLALQVFWFAVTLAVNGAGGGTDAPTYITPALSFLSSGRMLDEAGDPILLRTPGYPLLLALVYGCTGQSDLAVAIVQMLMVTAITLMIFRGVSQFTNRAVGVFASLFYAADLTVYHHAAYILTDVPFSFFVTWGAYALLRYLKTQKMAYLILCYAAVNFALLVRPNIMYLNIILFFALLLLSLFKKIPWKKTIPYLFLFLAVYGGWSLRNAACYGKPVYTTVRDDSVFIFYTPLLYSREEGCSETEARAIFEEELARQYSAFDNLDKLSQTAVYKKIGTAYIKEHIPGYILMNIDGLIDETVAPDFAFIRGLPLPKILINLLIAVSMGMLLLGYLIYAAGFFANIRKWTWLDWLLLFATLYFMASTAVLGYYRFRLAFYPICIMGTFLCWRSRLRPAVQE